MVKRNSLLGLCLGITLISVSGLSAAADAAFAAAEESLQEARQLCSGISESNKQLAKSAGYDIDKLCGSLELFDLPENGAAAEEAILPRTREKSAQVEAVSTKPPVVAAMPRAPLNCRSCSHLATIFLPVNPPASNPPPAYQSHPTISSDPVTQYRCFSTAN